MKIQDLFKEFDGMTLEGSTVEQRHEIWKLLFDLNLIYAQDSSFEMELFTLNSQAFYFEDCGEFVPEFISLGVPLTNISFEEFKNRLFQL